MDSTYAPQSPDLSGFHSSPSKHDKLYQPQPTSHNSSYAPQSPVLQSFGQQSQQYRNAYQQDPSPHSNYSIGGSEFSEYGNTQYMPPIPALPPSHPFGATSYQTYNPAPPSKQEYSHHDYSQQSLKQEPSYTYSTDGANDFSNNNNMAARTPRAPRVEGEDSFSNMASSAPAYKNPNPNNIDIRTKFPVARIKRIMQADEEVGKVAQVTPVAVNKALELFMIALVTGAAERAKEKGGKRVTAQHLKGVVEGDEQFDFLKEIVSRVADVQENAGGEGRKRKEKVEKSDDDSEEDKKPKKGKGRRKKVED